MKAKDLKKLKYDEALERLEDIVRQLEHKEIKVDDLSAKVKEASLLVEYCREKLQKTEDDIKKIISPQTKEEDDNIS